MDRNTVLFVEPRIFDKCPSILNQFVDILGEKEWNYVFYCGKNTIEHWKKTELNKIFELREIYTDNFTSPDSYSDFMKQRTLWDSIYGDFVLTAQLDAYITNDCGYNIYDFIKLDKSYIGGNMAYYWRELSREKINFEYRNFNGGLSLRKRKDMIRIIDTFPPTKSNNLNQSMNSDAEDVYFTIGCYRLHLPLGDCENCQHFSISTIFKDTFFGIHKPDISVGNRILKKMPELKTHNPFVFPPCSF